MNPFSAYAFPPPFYEPVIIQTLMSQVEYYLSVDNLCKDYFIRKRMDSKGFVRLTVIANFNRMRDLAPDLDHIRIACEASDNIDYVVGDDNIERLRLRNKWEIFVLSMEEREEEARNDGPSQWVSKSRHSTRSSYPGPMMMPNYMPTSPTAYPPLFSPEDQMFQPPYMNGAHYDPAMNGGDTNGQRYGMESQLSAAVPEFSPSGPGPFTLENATTFSDKQVEGLKVLVGYGKKDSPGADNQAHPAGLVANGAVNAPDHVQSNGTASPPGAPFR
jgi:la-related protein 1